MAAKKLKTITSSWPLPADGVRFQTPQFLIKLLSEHLLSRDIYPLASGYYPLAAGHAMERIRHESHLLIYCVAGSGQLSMAAADWAVGAGDLVCLPKGTAHAYRSSRRDPWSIYWVHYDGALAETYAEFIGIDLPVIHLGVHPALVASFSGLFAQRQGGFPEKAFIHAAAQLRELLTALGWWRSMSGSGRGASINLPDIEQLMRRRIAGSLRLEELAEEAGMSRFHFVRKFREQAGHSPIQHFIHLKMQQACQLLDSGDQSVKQVAMTLGYEDAYYFSRLFKKVMGVSPSDYQRHRSA